VPYSLPTQSVHVSGFWFVWGGTTIAAPLKENLHPLAITPRLPQLVQCLCISEIAGSGKFLTWNHSSVVF
jgi:hypothetical protein